jgi:hypothetical protein
MAKPAGYTTDAIDAVAVDPDSGKTMISFDLGEGDRLVVIMPEGVAATLYTKLGGTRIERAAKARAN